MSHLELYWNLSTEIPIGRQSQKNLFLIQIHIQFISLGHSSIREILIFFSILLLFNFTVWQTLKFSLSGREINWFRID